MVIRFLKTKFFEVVFAKKWNLSFLYIVYFYFSMKSIMSTKFSPIFDEIGMVDLGYKNRQIGSPVLVDWTMKIPYNISYLLFFKFQAKLLQSEILEEACKEPIWNDLSLSFFLFFKCFLCILLILGIFSTWVFSSYEK